MSPIIRRLLIPGLAVLALAACASTTPSQQPAGMAVAQQPKLAFNVSSIEVASTFKAPGQATHIEGLLAVPLEQRVVDWAKTRLTARGGADIARFTVTDASVVRTELGKNVGVPGLMRAPQTIRYDATIAVSFEVLDRFGARKAYANGRVSLGRTMAAFESDAARDVLLRNLSDAVMEEFDAEMVKVLRANVSGYMM